MSYGVSRIFIYSSLSLIVAVFVGGVVATSQHAPVPFSGHKTLDATALSEFSGTDADKPIYLALDGFVYDITAGKEFYQTGGPYHFLAGRDASSELHIAGAGIIRRKYPIVAAYIH